MKKVLLVEDENLIRRGLKFQMDWTAVNCVVAGEAASGQEGLEQIQNLQPDIVITDIRMPDTVSYTHLDVYKRQAEGEYVVGLTWEDPAAAYVRDGVAVKVVFPEEGALMSGQCVSIIRGAPHMENAKKFVDYMLGESCQNYVGQNLTVRPLRADATLNESLTCLLYTSTSPA